MSTLALPAEDRPKPDTEDTMPPTRRVAAILLAAALLVALPAAPAAAHVTAEPDEAHAPDFEIAFQVEHGCGESPTTAIRVRVPGGVEELRPQPLAGWDLEVERDGGDEGRVTEVAWVLASAAGEGAREFAVSGRFTGETGDVVYFPLVQECEQGEHRWIDVPPTLEEWGDLEEPAPYVVLAFRDARTATPTPAGCGPVETTPDEGHQHLLGDAEPPTGYRSTPPASGWHYRERDRVRLGVAAPEDPLTEAEQVTVLAVGGVVIGYRDLPAGGVEVLEEVVADAGERPVALTPYEALEPGEVALSAWRTVRRCDGVDRAAVEAFVEAHAADEPDYTMAGQHEEPAAPEPAATEPAADPPQAGQPAGGEGGDAVLPPEVLIAGGLFLLAGFGLAARQALRR